MQDSIRLSVGSKKKDKSKPLAAAKMLALAFYVAFRPSIGINGKITDLQDRFPAAMPQDILDPRDQLARLERLGT